MRKVLICALITVVFVSSAYGKTVETVELDGGGKRIETVFDKSDQEYRYLKKLSVFDKDGRKLKDESFLLENRYNDLGLKSVSKEYGGDGNLRNIEIEFRDDVAEEAGYKTIQLTLTDDCVKKQMIIIYADGNPDKRIYSKSVIFYDRVGTRRFARFYLTKAAQTQTGFVRYDEEYDANGEPYNQRFMTADGRFH